MRVALTIAVLCASATPLAAQNTTAQAVDRFSQAVIAARENDFVNAFNIFETLALAGDSEAAYNLALLYKRGWGRPENFRSALYWAWLSSLGGVAEAVALADGLAGLVPADVRNEEADRLSTELENRIEAGDRTAIIQYARVQSDILGEPNLQKAYVWYSIAAAIGLSEGRHAMIKISASLSSAELVEVQGMAADVFAESPFVN